ncbi:protein of unknown function [Burkholderia multivorans]
MGLGRRAHGAGRAARHPAFAKQGRHWRWPERDCTELLRAYERERPSYFSRQVSRALNLLADQVERRG